MIHDAVKRHDVADAKAIGMRIAKARRGRGWRQRDLAEAVGASLHTVTGWENGLRVPGSLTMLIRLCHALRRTADHLVMGRAKNARHW
jgi:transcriptional regulator with XRE-family HTH domain